MTLRFPVLTSRGVLTLLFTAALVSASDTAFYRAQLTPANNTVTTGSTSAAVDIKVHAVRDLAGNIVHGYVDFSLEGALAGNAAVSGLSIIPTSGTAIAVPTWRLAQTQSGGLPTRGSAPVGADNGGGLETLKALLEGSGPFSVSATTSRGTLRGQAERSTNHIEPLTAEGSVWKEVDDNSVALKVQMNTAQPPRFYRTFQMDQNALQAVLRTVPMQFSKASKPVISMPMPDGQLARFRIEESPVMAPELAAKVPNFKTYRGQGIDNPAATMRFDCNGGAVHAVVLVGQDTVYIHPAAQGDTEQYISYYKQDVPAAPGGANSFRPDSVAAPLKQSLDRTIAAPAAAGTPVGDTLRTYRLAIATTKGFTADPFYGGGGDGMAARMTTLTNVGTIVNMMNALYEADVAIQFVLIPNELNAIFDTTTNPDPGYTDGQTSAMIDQNQAFLDAAVGNGNYDIGHVFGIDAPGAGCDGIATTPATCNPKLKAAAATGFGCGKAWGGGFTVDVQVLDHEVAHQFNAQHTTNSTAGYCMQERNGPTAYEVGSGSTILANAGTCDPENLQTSTNTYFHANTLDVINAYVANGAGVCFVGSPTGNTLPAVTAPANVTIPMATPFTLTATATVANGNTATYTWEELDIGTASPPEGDDGTRPLFRSIPPNPSPSRTFPSMTYVLNNANQPPATIPCPDNATSTCIPGEYLPTTNRTMNFRVTVRDNHAGAGGTNFATMQVTSTTAAGPFQVTQPNTAVTWQTGSMQTVTWNVANTSAAPVNAANVNVLLSTDGGNTFPTMLAQNVANNGSATITVPNTPTANARVEVQAVGNIFFDVSDVNFTIVAPGMAAVTVNTAPTTGATGTALARVLSRNGQASVTPAATDKNILNLSFSMDGKMYSGSQTFMFPTNSIHTLSTPGTQNTSNTESQFSHWSNGGPMTQNITASSGTTTYTAFFNTQFELTMGVSPAGAGTVTPTSGQFYPDGSAVNVSATPNPGYVFSNWIGIPPPNDNGQFFPGQNSQQSPNQTVIMNAPKTLTAKFTEGPTNLAGVVASKTGPSNNRVWSIQVSNSGPGVADGAGVNSFRFRQTFGRACSPVVTTALPASAGNIAPGASGSAPVAINFSACPSNARFTVTIGLSANNGRATGSIVRHNDVP